MARRKGLIAVLLSMLTNSKKQRNQMKRKFRRGGPK